MSTAEGFGFDGVRTAFDAKFNSDSSRGVYLEDGFGGLTKLADTSDLAPDGTAFTADFDSPMPGANGPGVVFEGFSNGGSNNGIYLAPNGTTTLTTVATLADFPAISADVDSIDLGEPDVDAGRVVFSTRQNDFDQPFNTPGSTPAASVAFWENGSLTTIADQDTVLPNGQTADFFGESAIAGDYIAFGVFESGVRTAIVLHDLSDGTQYSVFELGQVIDGREVTGISFYSRPFLSDGYLAVDLTFDNTDDIIYRAAIIPEPTSLAMLGIGGLLVARRRHGRAN
ncbi:MAG: PEP-CTERM sorting domain-containing protein [Planctomycetota bacterium]